MLKRIKTNRRKGFTLIELIVVMAVLAVLVLLAAPKFLGKTEQAKLTQIQNDIRVAEDKLNAVLAGKPDALKAWEPAEAAELTELVSENKLMGRGGPALGLPTGDVWVIDDAFLDTEVRTKLNGDFFVDADGNVFYEHSKPVTPGKTETPPEKEEKPLTYEEWLAKVQAEGYVLATDADFSGETNGTFKYIGSDKLVIVPNVIKGVDVTSYKNMFEKTYAEGVASYNPNISNMASMFYNSYAPTLDVSRLNTTGVTDMNYMFSGSKATTLDLSSFDTSQVTNMSDMFYRSQATILDLSGFDTSQVTDMSWMFASSKATTLDLSSFDTAQVPGMSSMFNGSNATVGIARTTKDANRFKNSSNKPNGLTFTVPEQPVNYVLATDADFTVTKDGTFRYNGTNHYVIMPDTIKGVTVTSYENMFEYSDVRGVISDNPNITDMSRMFAYSYAPTLDVSRLNTTGVTDMSGMFYNSQATTLDLSSFDTANVTNMLDMFWNSKATTLDLSSFDTAKVTDMNYMFNGSKATTLDLSSFDTAKVTDVRRMFYGSQATTGIARTTKDVNRFNNSSDKPNGLTFTVPEQPVNYILATDADFTGTENGTFRYNGTNHYVIIPDTIKGVTVTSYENMFENSDVRGVVSDNPNITNMASMFYNSYAPTLDVSRLNTTGVTDMSDMFEYSKATTLDLSSFDTSQVTTMYDMFYRSQATTLDLSGFDTSQVTDMRYMFHSSKATTLDLRSFDLRNIVTGTTSTTSKNWNMFNGATARIGYARTTADRDKLNNTYTYRPSGLTFIVK